MLPAIQILVKMQTSVLDAAGCLSKCKTARSRYSIRNIGLKSVSFNLMDMCCIANGMAFAERDRKALE